MPTFKYVARNRKGQKTEGTVKADTRDLAALHLRELGVTVTSLNEVKGVSDFFKFFAASPVKKKEIAIFTRQLYTLLAAGMSIVAALKALEMSTSNIRFKNILARLRTDLETGSSLSVACAKYPNVFDELYCSMVKSGEESGRLVEILDRLAAAVIKEEETRQKIKQAMSYPIILGVTMLLAILVLGLFVVPRFAKMFQSFHAELPLPTKILIATNNFIINYWFIVIIGVAVAVYIFRRLIKTTLGRYLWDRFKLRAYIFGPLFLRIYMSRFSYLVATLIHSGVSVMDTFDLVRQTATNTIVAKTIKNIGEKVRQGRTIASAMAEEPLFPELVVQMVRIGEEAGRIDELLEQVSKFYEDEADGIINNLTVLIEPILLMTIASIVLVMALAIFLPLWNMHSAMQ